MLAGASEPRNMAYMIRLGLWGEGTAFNDFTEFIQMIEKRYFFLFTFICLSHRKQSVIRFSMKDGISYK